jgi:transketolase
MSLRAIPNLWVVRPGDPNETVGAWRLALERDGGPVAFAPSRQKLPVLGGDGIADTREGPLRGGYVLWQRDPGAEPDAIVIATGSELPIALDGAHSLEANVRVVSLPCWEVFDAQPEGYRDEVLPPAVTARVSVEAGITFGWERWVGPRGASIGVDRFGASAPAERIYEELGVTAGAVAAAVERLLA